MSNAPSLPKNYCVSAGDPTPSDMPSSTMYVWSYMYTGTSTHMHIQVHTRTQVMQELGRGDHLLEDTVYRLLVLRGTDDLGSTWLGIVCACVCQTVTNSFMFSKTMSVYTHEHAHSRTHNTCRPDVDVAQQLYKSLGQSSRSKVT